MKPAGTQPPAPGTPARTPSPALTAWRFVMVFGVVSLLMDFVYEGARSVTGPLLAHLGASAAVVGIVTGAGEAAALGLRLVSGPLADRSGRFWAWTVAGYALTAAAVPLLGLAGALWAACTLVVTERVGKAVRSPAKDTLLSHATAATGRGRGFAVHEAMDQIGALLGPLTVAGVLALTGDDYAPALGVLALPGVAALALLLRLRAKVVDPAAYETTAGEPTGKGSGPGQTGRPRLPRAFWVYAAFTAATLLGFATFGVLSYHLVARHLIPTATVPVLYAAAMAADALAALATGWLYDHLGARVLVVLPVLSAAVPLLAFTDTVWIVVLGALVWGAAVGVQESTLRATVADLVPMGRRATAYGIFAGIMGAAAMAGGALTGILYDVSIPTLITVVVTVQAASLVLLWATRAQRA
ncbi:MFS transporter [Streptomyces pluripotens]|uniref:MFS transporter n=1 Tax=Streptomyces pluripotens TaxID=1355015 RepID=A0A221NSU6_9ACTN|nr:MULTISPECIES: MFS transporter [Streptomyces]ARP68597.1 MFS transporter [Streptomyces pluripotens]ASN22858.1 MFS transporter [Streptomyces pluripotens]